MPGDNTSHVRPVDRGKRIRNETTEEDITVVGAEGVLVVSLGSRPRSW